MAESKASDSVPNLGFKDKDKALETIKELEGRDPDYQKLAIKGLIGRANRVLGITKAEDKLKNIKDAVKVFEDWLRNFEKLNLGKENRAYLPLPTIKVFQPLQKHYGIDNAEKIQQFLEAYEGPASGEYKKLRTVESAPGESTWDIVRNKALKGILKEIDESAEYWTDEGIPSKKHTELILWGYSPDAAKIKKQLTQLEEKVNKLREGGKKSEEKGASDKKKECKRNKSDSESDESDESPKKKKRANSSSEESD